MYTLLLIGCVLALTLCPLLLDVLLTRRFERQSPGITPTHRRAARFALAATDAQ